MNLAQAIAINIWDKQPDGSYGYLILEYSSRFSSNHRFFFYYQGNSVPFSHGCSSNSLAVFLGSGTEQSIFLTAKFKNVHLFSPSRELIVSSSLNLGMRSRYKNLPKGTHQRKSVTRELGGQMVPPLSKNGPL
jgi:hypothetical protein